MEYYSNSDPCSFGTAPSVYFPETASSSSQRSASDEEVILAASRPKKRAGRKKVKETRHPVYRGVRQRNADKWVCELREPTEQKRIWLGTYPTAEMAARAHDVAAMALRGSAACLNFADSVWRLPVPASREAKDLRKAAAEAAEAFRPGAGAGAGAGGDAYVERGVEDQERGVSGGFPELYDVVYDDMSMAAEGVMLSPPPHVGWSFGWDEVESEAEVELWRF